VSRLRDIDINCAARRILVRRWIDLGKTSLRTTNGVLTIYGTLEKLLHAASPLTPSIVNEMAAELRRISGVRRLSLNFTNWAECDGKWNFIAEKKEPPIMRKELPTPGVLEIDEAEVPKDMSEIYESLGLPNPPPSPDA